MCERTLLITTCSFYFWTIYLKIDQHGRSDHSNSLRLVLASEIFIATNFINSVQFGVIFCFCNSQVPFQQCNASRYTFMLQSDIVSVVLNTLRDDLYTHWLWAEYRECACVCVFVICSGLNESYVRDPTNINFHSRKTICSYLNLMHHIFIHKFFWYLFNSSQRCDELWSLNVWIAYIVYRPNYWQIKFFTITFDSLLVKALAKPIIDPKKLITLISEKCVWLNWIVLMRIFWRKKS